MSRVQPELIENTKRQNLRQVYIDALKSGKYKQAMRVLRSNYTILHSTNLLQLSQLFTHDAPPIIEHGYGYCAIGLAFEIMGGDWNRKSGGEIYQDVSDAYGVSVSELINLNDSGHSFKAIAHLLETSPLVYWE